MKQIRYVAGIRAAFSVKMAYHGGKGRKNMNKNYETVWEIFNECANNRMRDVFFDEIETDDTDAYVKGKFKDKQITFEKSVLEDGTIVYDIDASGIRERFSFTEI